MLAIIDIDGTIADCSHRLHYLDEKPPNWDAFFAAMIDDTPIKGMADLLNSLDLCIIYITGRPDSYYDVTVKWLEKHGFPQEGCEVFMRTDGDKRPDTIVKREIYEDMVRVGGYGSEPYCKPEDVLFAIEDRKRVVDMWRSLGILTLQPKDGDY